MSVRVRACVWIAILNTAWVRCCNLQMYLQYGYGACSVRWGIMLREVRVDIERVEGENLQDIWY